LALCCFGELVGVRFTLAETSVTIQLRDWTLTICPCSGACTITTILPFRRIEFPSLALYGTSRWS